MVSMIVPRFPAHDKNKVLLQYVQHSSVVEWFGALRIECSSQLETMDSLEECIGLTVI